MNHKKSDLFSSVFIFKPQSTQRAQRNVENLCALCGLKITHIIYFYSHGSRRQHPPLPGAAARIAEDPTPSVTMFGWGRYSSRVEMKMKLHDMEARSNDDLIMSKTSGISFYH